MMLLPGNNRQFKTSDPAELLDRIDALDLKFMRNSRGRMCLDIKINVTLGNFISDDEEADGGLSDVEHAMVRRLIRHALKPVANEDGDRMD
jgi:hypothetical protein